MAREFAYLFILFAGALMVAFYKRLNFTVRHPYIFSLILWGFGLLTFKLGESQSSLSILSMAGLMVMCIAASIFFYKMMFERQDIEDIEKRTNVTDRIALGAFILVVLLVLYALIFG